MGTIPQLESNNVQKTLHSGTFGLCDMNTDRPTLLSARLADATARAMEMDDGHSVLARSCHVSIESSSQ